MKNVKLHNLIDRDKQRVSDEEMCEDTTHYVPITVCSSCKKRKRTQLVSADIKTRYGVERKFLGLCDECIKKYE